MVYRNLVELDYGSAKIDQEASRLTKKIDQEASRTMLNFNKAKRGFCSLPDCQSQEHKTYQCPRLLGKDVSEAIMIANRANICVTCLNLLSPDHQCPNIKFEGKAIEIKCGTCTYKKKPLNRGICKHANRPICTVNTLTTMEVSDEMDEECRIFEEDDEEANQHDQEEIRSDSERIGNQRMETMEHISTSPPFKKMNNPMGCRT